MAKKVEYVKMDATVVHADGPLYAGQTYGLPPDVVAGLVATNAGKRSAAPSTKEFQPDDKSGA